MSISVHLSCILSFFCTMRIGFLSLCITLGYRVGLRDSSWPGGPS